MGDDTLPQLKYDAADLIPAVIMDRDTGALLMVAYMNSQSLATTIETGYTHFWSRSRQKYWKKGETSGHVQRVHSIHTDCDSDTLLVLVEQTGPACHTGSYSCFFKPIVAAKEALPSGSQVPEAVFRTILDRKHRRPAGSYVSSLLGEGREKVAAKVREEGEEVIAASQKGNEEEIVQEAADLLFHTMVLLASHEIPLSDVFRELARRHSPDEPGGGKADPPGGTGG